MNKSKQISFVVSREFHEALEILAAACGTSVGNTVRLMAWKELIGCELLDAGTPLTEQAASLMPFRRELPGITGEASR